MSYRMNVGPDTRMVSSCGLKCARNTEAMSSMVGFCCMPSSGGSGSPTVSYQGLATVALAAVNIVMLSVLLFSPSVCSGKCLSGVMPMPDKPQ